MLRVWNVLLICITFLLTIFGTFLTRSGLISSVHSFAQSDIGIFFVWFLGFVAITLAITWWAARRTSGSSGFFAAGRSLKAWQNGVAVAGDYMKPDESGFDRFAPENVAAVAASLKGFPRKLVLIAGGVDKGGSYVDMFDALREVGKGMVLIGAAASKVTRTMVQPAYKDLANQSVGVMVTADRGTI